MSITLRIINVSYNVQYMYLDEIHINLKLETVTSKFSSVQERFLGRIYDLVAISEMKFS